MQREASENAVSLRKWLKTAFAGFAASLLLAMVWVVWPALSDYRHTERNLRGIETYRQLLTAANRLSAERGPSNVMMSIELGSDPAAVERLAEFRRLTDLSLEDALAADRSWGGAQFTADLLQMVRATRQDLAEARANVDRVAATASHQRSYREVRFAVDGMIGAADLYQGVLDASARALGRMDPLLVGKTMIAQSVSDLREFGGRIASYIIPSVSRGERLTSEELRQFHQAEGRLWEIDRLLQAQFLLKEDAEVRALTKEIRERFFGEGLGFLRRVVAEGSIGSSYSIETSQITALYVPTLKPLENLRNVYFSRMIEEFEARRKTALSRLLLTLAASALFLAVAFWFLYSVRLKLLHPLLGARDMIVSLADNQVIEPAKVETSISEMRTLFGAIAVLADQTSERRRLVEHFRVQAETDRLTGLANRRRFDAMAHQALQAAQAGRFGILYLDLDRFKSVNDKLGHPAGDALLIEVARRLQGLCDNRVCLARLGGDEFAALCDGLSEAGQVSLAREIVRSLAQPFMIEGHEARIGASVGIAVLHDRDTPFDQLCRQADMALYEAKAAGRDRFQLFTPDMEAMVRERAAHGPQPAKGGEEGASDKPKTGGALRFEDAA